LDGFGLDKRYFSELMGDVTAAPSTKAFNVRIKDNQHTLQSPLETDFAILDVSTSETLQDISDLSPVSFQAVLTSNDITKYRSQFTRSGEATGFGVSLNIFGPRKHASLIGKALSKRGTFLQLPYLLPEGIEYENPHYFKVPSGKPAALPKSSTVETYSQTTETEMSSILNSLDHRMELQRMNADASVLTVLMRYCDVNRRKKETVLTAHRHQEEGLHFISQRERSDVTGVFSLWDPVEEGEVKLYCLIFLFLWFL
jgi:hypothetical protein